MAPAMVGGPRPPPRPPHPPPPRRAGPPRSSFYVRQGSGIWEEPVMSDRKASKLRPGERILASFSGSLTFQFTSDDWINWLVPWLSSVSAGKCSDTLDHNLIILYLLPEANIHGAKVVVASKFFALATNICGPSVWRHAPGACNFEVAPSFLENSFQFTIRY
jgi:hypothetical protein